MRFDITSWNCRSRRPNTIPDNPTATPLSVLDVLDDKHRWKYFVSDPRTADRNSHPFCERRQHPFPRRGSRPSPSRYAPPRRGREVPSEIKMRLSLGRTQRNLLRFQRPGGEALHGRCVGPIHPLLYHHQAEVKVHPRPETCAHSSSFLYRSRSFLAVTPVLSREGEQHQVANGRTHQVRS
jgi:hypothetical protein